MLRAHVVIGEKRACAPDPRSITDINRMTAIRLFEKRVSPFDRRGEFFIGIKGTEYEFKMPISRINVRSYPFLKQLFAAGNKLTEIPETLGSLPCLRSLVLSSNKLGLATNWNWILNSPFIRENLLSLWLDRNELTVLPEAIFKLKNLESLYIHENLLTELPAEFGTILNLRNIYADHNKLSILPASMYRKEGFTLIRMRDNNFQPMNIHHSECLKMSDFETIGVPSLFQLAGTFIINNRFPFWDYNLPKVITDCLERTYNCRCGSVVFPDSSGKIVKCTIKTNALANMCDMVLVPMYIYACSYECYKMALDIVASGGRPLPINY